MSTSDTKVRISRYLEQYLASVAPGDPLPSYRKVMQGCRASYDTVAEVVDGLSQRGLVEVRQRSGIYKSDRQPQAGTRPRNIDVFFFGSRHDLQIGRFHGELSHEIMLSCSEAQRVPRYHILGRNASALDIEPLLRQPDVEACILVALRNDEQLRCFRDSGVAYVNMFPTNLATIDLVPSIHTNDDRVIEQQLRHLQQLGHEKIAYLHTAEPGAQHGTAELRVDHFESLIHERNLPIEPHWIQCAGFDPEQTFDAVDAVFRTSNRPTAVITYDIHVAWVYAALQRRGLRIPHDISVVSTDDLPISSMLYPAVSSLRTDRRAAVQHALSMLDAFAPDRPEAAAPPRFECPTRVVNRHSTLAIAPPAVAEVSHKSEPSYLTSR